MLKHIRLRDLGMSRNDMSVPMSQRPADWSEAGCVLSELTALLQRLLTGGEIGFKYTYMCTCIASFFSATGTHVSARTVYNVIPSTSATAVIVLPRDRI